MLLKQRPINHKLLNESDNFLHITQTLWLRRLAALGDLDFAEQMGAVVVKSANGMYGYGYTIGLGENIQRAQTKAAAFLSLHRKALDTLVNEFGHKNAKQLELLTTIIYLNKEIMFDENKMPRSVAIEKIRELKPKFTDLDVQRGMDELEKQHHVKLVFAND